MSEDPLRGQFCWAMSFLFCTSTCLELILKVTDAAEDIGGTASADPDASLPDQYNAVQHAY